MSALDTAGRRLRKAVWDPVASRAGEATTIFLVPDGSWSHVDFGALPMEDGTFVAESGPRVQVLSTGRDLLRYARMRRSVSTGVLLVGNPDFGAPGSASTRGTGSDCVRTLGLEWAPLPESETEIRHIGEQFGDRAPTVLLTGAGADEATLKREVAGKRVVHLATHGFFLDESCDRSAPVANPWSSVLPDEISGNPLLLSGLALAGANQARDSTGAEDGILTAEEVASLNLDGVELVVLSACETGRGGAVTGQGVLGLRRALEIAGARTVVMSLWQVPDREARRWMTTMYAEWLDGAPVAEAARRASLAALERLRERGQSAHPYLWTGFVTAGDWR